MKRLVFHLGHSAGFYSEFNNMVLAILYCQLHGIEFEIYSADANFKVSKGWDDYFLPFCKETRSIVHHYINHRFEAPRGGKRKILYCLYKKLYPDCVLTSELWDEFRHIDKTEISTEETRFFASRIVDDIYRFNADVQLQIDELTRIVKLEKPYVGFHIRGGDKKIETTLVGAENYFKKAEMMTDIRLGFISTDDYRFVEELNDRLSGWELYTLSSKDNRGFSYQDYVRLDAESKHKEMVNLFASVELLSKATMTFCTFSSNIGMFLGMRMGDRAIGVDMDHWMIW